VLLSQDQVIVPSPPAVPFRKPVPADVGAYIVPRSVPPVVPLSVLFNFSLYVVSVADIFILK